METIALATQDQLTILNTVSSHPFFRQFYFTGGTALSYLYLEHRYSEDLDFFSEKSFDREELSDIIVLWSKKFNFTFELNSHKHMDIYNLTFLNGQTLKLDFVHEPHIRLEKGKVWHTLAVDSLIDIATNKLLTTNQRTTVKDFVDLYFLLQTHSLYDLMEGVKVKFGIKLDTILVASDFLKVDFFTFLPRMIKPLTLIDLQTFFHAQAVELSKQAIE